MRFFWLVAFPLSPRDCAPHRDDEWAERGEITLEEAAKIIGVCNMTALRMLRRGDIKAGK